MEADAELRRGFGDTEVRVRPVSPWSFREIVELWEYRDLFWALVARDVRVRYAQAVLGVAWAVIQPVTQVLVFTVLLHRFAHIESDAPVPYPVFCLAGMVPWQLFATGLAQASDSLIGSAGLITKVYFPRLIIPLASILTACVELAIGMALLLVVLLTQGVPVRPGMLLAFPLLVLAFLATVSLGLWTSAINAQYRDVRHALPFVMQLLVFVTPVFYPVSLLPAQYRWCTALNPIAPIIEAFRAALFGIALPWGRLALGGLVTMSVGFSGYLYFRSVERTLADRV